MFYTAGWSRSETFLRLAGIARLLEGAKRYRVALMCSEEEPCRLPPVSSSSRGNCTTEVWMWTHIRGDGKSTESTEKVAGVQDGTDP